MYHSLNKHTQDDLLEIQTTNKMCPRNFPGRIFAD